MPEIGTPILLQPRAQRFQPASLLRDRTQVVHIALERGQGTNTDPASTFIEALILTGQMVEGLGFVGTGLERILGIGATVLILEPDIPGLVAQKVRDVGVDRAPGVAVP
ncbi:MAG: hypothetical protein ACUVQI_01165 [Thermochromatium sp.]